MTRKDNTDDGYVLTATAGYDLAVLDESGSIMARAKEVLIPAAGTLNVWTEVVEEVPQPVEGDPQKDTKIAELKAELAKLQTN